MRVAYFWIKSQVDVDAAAGIDVAGYGHSKVRQSPGPVPVHLSVFTYSPTLTAHRLHRQVVVQTTASLETNAAGGGDRPEDEADDPDKVHYVSRTDAEALASGAGTNGTA